MFTGFRLMGYKECYCLNDEICYLGSEDALCLRRFMVVLLGRICHLIVVFIL